MGLRLQQNSAGKVTHSLHKIGDELTKCAYTAFPYKLRSTVATQPWDFGHASGTYAEHLSLSATPNEMGGQS